MAAGDARHPVSVWHEARLPATPLMSDVGLIEGMLVPQSRLHHCPGRHRCTYISQPLPRRLLLRRRQLRDLGYRLHPNPSEQAKRPLTIRVDHCGANGPAAWTYRLLPLRWRNVDPPGHIDADLVIAVWPD